MALTYSEFSTTGANLLTDLRTAILASTDWSRPNAGSLPNLLKCTTTRGADMIVDLNDSAPTTQRMQIAAYRTHDGTTGADKATRYLRYRSGGTFNTNTYRCIVSAGKEHLFVSVEGPRAGEVGADNAQFGSNRSYFFFSDVIPYYTGADDTAPCVAFHGRAIDASSEWVSGAYTVHISRSRAGTDSWLPARLPTLDLSHQGSGIYAFQRISRNGDVVLSPYVVFEDSDGIRGRLASFHFAGWNFTDVADISTLSAGSKQTYNGQLYKILAVDKTGGQNERVYGPFGSVSNGTGGIQHRSALVAVPCT